MFRSELDLKGSSKIWGFSRLEHEPKLPIFAWFHDDIASCAKIFGKDPAIDKREKD